MSGYAVDGQEWPKNWSCDYDTIQHPAERMSWLSVLSQPLQTSDVIEQLAEWSGVPLGYISAEQRGFLRFAPAASARDIQDCEARLNTKLNDQYKELLGITNGFGIKRGRPYEILGASDIDFIGDSGELIGVTPLYEDGFVVMKVTDERQTPRCYILTSDGQVRDIGDLKKHVSDSLLWDMSAE